MSTLPGLLEGRVVHYVYGEHDGCKIGEVGACRPGTPVRVWRGIHAAEGYSNLIVFTDFGNDFEPGQAGARGLLWATSKVHDSTGKPGTWHWPAECRHAEAGR